MHRTRDGACVSSCPLSGLAHICTGTGPSPATSAPGLGPCCHIFTGTGLAAAASAPGLGSSLATSAPGLSGARPAVHVDVEDVDDDVLRDAVVAARRRAHLVRALRGAQAGGVLFTRSIGPRGVLEGYPTASGHICAGTQQARPAVHVDVEDVDDDVLRDAAAAAWRRIAHLVRALRGAQAGGVLSTRSIGPRGLLGEYSHYGLALNGCARDVPSSR